MGDLMRQYWIPALTLGRAAGAGLPAAAPAPAGREPDRLPRRPPARSASIQNSCPHRGASMFFGRNEEEGLRCVYHGWKFDVDRRLRRHAVGAGREQLQEQGAHARLPVRASATASSGPTWARARRRRRCPTSRPTCCRTGEYAVGKTLRECNWMQALEGDIDTGHLGFLHLGAARPGDAVPRARFDYYAVRDRAPQVRRASTPSSARPTAPTARRRTDTYYWRIAHFLFPFYTMIPTGVLGEEVRFGAWVPIDDDHMMSWRVSSRAARCAPVRARPAAPASRAPAQPAGQPARHDGLAGQVPPRRRTRRTTT